METEQNCNILTPTLMAITAFLSHSPGRLNRGPGGLASLGHGPHSSIFSPTYLNFLSPGLYNNLTCTYSLRASQFRTQFNPPTVKVAPDLLISSTGSTCYLHRCISYFDSLAGSEVNIQHTQGFHFHQDVADKFLTFCVSVMILNCIQAQSTEIVEYTDSFSHKCSTYKIKPS